MQELRFYHLTRTSLEQALPKLLEKTLARGKRAVVLTRDSGESEALVDSLWRYEAGSFLPHGSEQDNHADQQPIWITDKEQNSNHSSYLFVTAARFPDFGRDFELVAILFQEGRDGEVDAARGLWRQLRESSQARLSYWYQEASGAWAQKNG
jgi:DNA polymerase III subunit chi